MTRVSSVISAFSDIAGTITLEETDRHRRRMKMTSDNGVSFLLDLPEARLLRHGDGLLLDDGRVIQVLAAPEPNSCFAADSTDSSEFQGGYP